ncbi:cyclic AMP-responsive element-binding protein 3-like protein 4 [Synchiropus splendidus]|uniref:cyclic AMP-responsive element-binding protein 3-like protein 4 n=1 Tax=Synchiropus splendidus TaxID=270530 RepID=UPI00237EBD2B|nr:cyclic AMP-responsive element-binding protein 3-like protein 4 [Synchiropus splendidus]
MNHQNPPAAPMHFYPDRKFYHDSYSHHTLPEHVHFPHECPRKVPYMLNVPTAEPRPHSHHCNQEMLERLRMLSSDGVAGSDPNQQADDSSQKRVLRLISNRIAARECRQRKKDYLRHLEIRAHDLERQNHMLMEEIRSLRAANGNTNE